MEINYIPDKEVNLERADSLGSEPYVTTLMNIISKANTPFTIGLFGGWGVGKSSIITTIKDKFNDDIKSKITVFTYDAWKYLNDSFRRTFLYELKEFFKLETTNAFDSFYEDRSEDIDHKLAVKKFSGWWWLTLSPLLLILIWLFTKAQTDLKIAVTIISIFLTIITTLLRETFVQYKVTVTKQKIFAPEQFEKVFSEIISKILNKPKDKWEWIKFWKSQKPTEKVVIVIDNIDRCHRSLAFELLLTIKGFLEQKGVVFVIPIDEGEIKKHLKNQGNEPNEFLRKLFNTTISIKGISESDFFDFSKKLNDDYNLGFQTDIISIISQQFSKNPRKIIQFLNVLQTEILLSKNQENKELIPKGSIIKNLTFLTKLLIVREEWPNLYQVFEEYSHKLKDIYASIIKGDNGKFKFENFEINNEQRNFLRRTNHIIPDHKNFELFFINKDSFRNIPESTNSLVESNDIEGLRQQLNSDEISFDNLVQFIDGRFEKALKRNEIKTTVVVIVNLLFSLSIDEELKNKINPYLIGGNKFLGGFRNFINSDRINEIIKDIDNVLLIHFIKINNQFNNLLNNLIAYISEGENHSEFLFEFVASFKDKPDLISKVSSKFCDYLSKNNEFSLEAIPFLENNESLIPNLVSKELIDEYIEKIENKIGSDSLNQKLKIVSLYNKTSGLQNSQINAIVEKINGFINSVNDFIKLPFWLNCLKPYLSNIETLATLKKVFSIINTKQNWLWQQYGGSWNKEDYKRTLKVFLQFITKFYCSTSDSSQRNQLIAWLNQYFKKNESKDLIKFISKLLYSIVFDLQIYSWPFSQIIINRFSQVKEWDTKQEIAKTINLMLTKTTEEDGLSKEQIRSIFTSYINQMNDGNQDEIIGWISDSLKNTFLSESLESVISDQTDERKFELLDILKTLENNKLIVNVISIALRDVKCDNIEGLFDKLEGTEIDKQLINNSIKIVLREIGRENSNFDCLIKFLSTFEKSDRIIENLIAEKVKNLLATNNNDDILFAIEVLENINVTDKHKLNAIKAIIQDIDEGKFQDLDLETIKNIKKKYK